MTTLAPCTDPATPHAHCPEHGCVAYHCCVPGTPLTELTDAIVVHHLPVNAVRPELHALVIGGAAVGIVSATTVVTDGRSITTFVTEDGYDWPQPSGDGAHVVLRAALDPRAPAPRPCDIACISAKGASCTCECGGRNHGALRLPPEQRPVDVERMARSARRTAAFFDTVAAQNDRDDEAF